MSQLTESLIERKKASTPRALAIMETALGDVA